MPLGRGKIPARGALGRSKAGVKTFRARLTT
jgi:hypothetical protein